MTIPSIKFRILLAVLLFSTPQLHAQKNLIGANLDNNIIITAAYDIDSLDLSVGDVNQTRTFFTYGRSIAPNLYITTGLGFEIMSLTMVQEPYSLLHIYESRRFLVPLGLRYVVDVTNRLAISGQAGAQMGIFVSGKYKYLNRDGYAYTEQKKGVFENITFDLNFALGADIKLNSRNVINIGPNAIINTKNMLKSGKELKPISVGLRLGYIHLF